MIAVLTLLLLPLGALAAPAPKQSPPQALRGTLTQLAGKAGCLVDRSARGSGCEVARALAGPGPFMGSRAIAVSDAVNVFRRNR